MTQKSSNPFDGWLPFEQCIGQLVGFDDAGHKQWCALGRMEIAGLPYTSEIVAVFNGFLIDRTGADIISNNDVRGQTPDWFRRMWDKFLAQPIAYEARDPFDPWPLEVPKDELKDSPCFFFKNTSDEAK